MHGPGHEENCNYTRNKREIVIVRMRELSVNKLN